MPDLPLKTAHAGACSGIPRARRLWAFAFIALTASTAFSASAQTAQQATLEELRAQQQSINEQLKELQQLNQQLQQKMQAVEASQRALESEKAPKQAQAENAPAPSETPQQAPVDVGYNQGGGGFYIRTDEAQFRMLGYVQAVGSLYDKRLDRPDGNSEFDIRGARLDFIADFNDKFQAFIEIDGAPGSLPGQSDFGLVVATGNWKVLDDDLQLLFGKIIVPFNHEDTTSSRSIDTIERGLAINSLFLLPATDSQFGAEVHGELGADNQWIYHLGVYNGNGNAFDNTDENNGDKNLEARVDYVWSPTLTTGIALDFDDEEEQILTLADLGFSSYVSVPIKGARRGVDTNFEWRPHPFHLTGEFLALAFDGDSSPPVTTGLPLIPQHGKVKFYGGYIQPSYFLRGDHSEGLELLFRAEGVTLDANTGGDGDTLYAGTFGVNWFISPNTRLQVNAISHYFNGPSVIRGFDDDKFIPLLLTEMQFKF